MNIWELLGIPPTTEIAKIKSAYARQAKLYHPEEHPEEFKALQNAYKMAVRIAKSQKAENKYAEGVAEREPEPTADMREREPELTADMREREPELTADMREREPEPATDTPGVESESETPHDTYGEEEKERRSADTSGQQEERIFDYSSVDSYGDRERFYRQFLLLAKSPYLRNNLDAWDEFLSEKEFKVLFADTDFRINFVRTMCRQSGWRRKTVLYFEQYLKQFHTDQNKPANGKWETQLACFRIRKLPRFRLPAFCMDRFLGKAGRTFHKKIWSRLSSSLGRELNFDMKADVVRYMKLYLFFGESNQATGDFVNRLHRSWLAQQTILTVGILAVCFLVVFTGTYSAEHRKEKGEQLQYIRALYGEELDGCTEQELEEELGEYNYNWRRAEKGIDDVLERYESWCNSNRNAE